MANDNMNSPKDAAMAILAKAQKLLDNKSSATIEDIKGQDMKKSAEHTSGLHTVAYYGLDKHNPQQAALEVLSRAQDMLSETTSIGSDGLKKSAEAESGMHKVEYYSAGSLEKADMLHDNVAQRRQGRAKDYKAHGDHNSHKIAIEGAKESHKEQLGALKAQPKPNLPKSEGMSLCEKHAMGKTEGVTIVKSEGCSQCMVKSEWNELYEDLAKMEKYEGEDPTKENEIGTKFAKGEGTENKKAPSNDMKPKIEEKPIERDNQDFETKPGHAPENDHREMESHPTPDQNPAAHGQGSNPPAGTKPVNGKGIHKLSFFMGHRHHKNASKKMNPAG
jgi:hypothetical protein